MDKVLHKDLRILLLMSAIFLLFFYLPLQSESFITALYAALDLSRWYAREHVVLCLLPAFLIAGVISVFVSQGAVIKYLGARAKKWVAYTVASVSGSILAVCSCTILPLFSSIHKRGAGLGPAIAFLYSGPAINILAIILTARILGYEMGIARIIGAVLFAIICGSLMSFIFRKEEKARAESQMSFPEVAPSRPLWQTSLHFFSLVLILVFANWGNPEQGNSSSFWFQLWQYKWHITGFFSLGLAASLIFILKIKAWKVILVGVVTTASAVLLKNPLLTMIIAISGVSLISLKDKHEENREWIFSSWFFAKQILPLLIAGVLIAGFFLGSVHETSNIPGIIPNNWVAWLVGGNSIFANLSASILGAFMYFATLTEVPILQGLLASGMGKGPALALLLAGPSLSLPNMLVIRGVIGTRKTLAYISIVIVLSTLAGIIYGTI